MVILGGCYSVKTEKRLKIGTATVDSIMEFPQKTLKIELPFDPPIPLLGIHPESPKTPIRKNICTPIFTAVLITIASI